MRVLDWGPPDWAQLQWHVDPGSLRYKSCTTAARAVKWLNTHDGPHADWHYRVGPCDPATGRILLERRWTGADDGAVGSIE